MDLPDPWAVLGVAPGSPLTEARAARRKLAKELHPDLQTDRSPAERAERAARMAMVNRALAEIEQRGEKGGPVAPPSPVMPDSPTGDDSFSVGYLPAEAFEMLFLAAYGLGDILAVDEPYVLELYLLEPAPCFCLVTLFPEAGGSLVTVDITPASDSVAAPPAAAVIDVLVAELERLAAST